MEAARASATNARPARSHRGDQRQRTVPVRWGFLGAGYVASRAMAPAVHAADGAVLQVVGRPRRRPAPRRSSRCAPSRPTARCAPPTTSTSIYVCLPNDAPPAVGHGRPRRRQARAVREAARARRGARSRLMADAADARRCACWSRPPGTDGTRAPAAPSSCSRRPPGPAQVHGPGSPSPAYPRATTGWTRRAEVGRLLDVGCYVVAAALWAMGGVRSRVARRAAEHLGATGVDLTTTAVLASGDRPRAR